MAEAEPKAEAKSEAEAAAWRAQASLNADDLT